MISRSSLLPLAVLALLLATPTFAADPTTNSAVASVDGIPPKLPEPKYKMPGGLEAIKVDPNTSLGRVVVTARRYLDSLRKKEMIVVPTSEFIEIETAAARRLRDAELLAAKTREDRLAVHKACVAFAEHLRQRLHERRNIDSDFSAYSAADYFLAEAEYALEKASQ